MKRLYFVVVLSLAGVLWPNLGSSFYLHSTKKNVPLDDFIVINIVELPETGMDPNQLTLVLKESIKGCRLAIDPLVERTKNEINVLPRSTAIQKGRIPCSTQIKHRIQLVYLGKLEPGTYRVHVRTEQSTINKILNVY